jgi:hypothetical protein
MNGGAAAARAPRKLPKIGIGIGIGIEKKTVG